VDPEGILARRFAPAQIVGSVVYTTAMNDGPCAVQVQQGQSLVIGALDEAGQQKAAAGRAVSRLRHRHRSQPRDP
jgi:2-dehydropantoate 2-reductase